jgi:sugar phosphate isomerase/epimerase
MKSHVSSLTLAHLTIGGTPMENIAAAARAGFQAVGLRICARRPGDAYAPPILGRPQVSRELKRRADELGVRLSNVSGYQFYPDVTLGDVEPVVASAAELGVPVIVANGFDPDESRFTDLFARYCDLARSSGIRIALEFLPYSGVRDLDTALRIVASCDADNAGVLVDALHLERSGATPERMRGIPAGRVVFAQLCDAPAWHGPRTDEALMSEARGARLPAGTGVLPLFDFLDALPVDCEIEYEVARGDMMDRSPDDKALAAAADAERFFAAYEAAKGHAKAGNGA